MNPNAINIISTTGMVTETAIIKASVYKESIKYEINVKYWKMDFYIYIADLI